MRFSLLPFTCSVAGDGEVPTSISSDDFNKFVFVYGSLLNEREAKSVFSESSWDFYRPALLKGYKRIYNKWSLKRHGCVLNIEPSVNNSVMGLLFGPLSSWEMDKISRREQWSKHYDCIAVTVNIVGSTENVKCVTSIAKKFFLRKGAISTTYRKTVEEGLRQLSSKFQMPDFLINYGNNTYDSDGEPIR